MRADERVAVHVHDPGSPGTVLGDLVHVALGRQAGTDVHELADARLRGEVTDDAPQERPVRAGTGGASGVTCSAKLTTSRSAAKLSFPPRNAS